MSIILDLDTTAGTLFNYIGHPARVLGDGGFDVGKGRIPLVAIAYEYPPTVWHCCYIPERDFHRDMQPIPQPAPAALPHPPRTPPRRARRNDDAIQR